MTSGFGVRPNRYSAKNIQTHGPNILFKIDRIIRNPNLIRYFCDIFIILSCGTDTIFVCIVPIFHKDPNYIIALLFKSNAVTDESTPPLMPTTTRVLLLSAILSPSFQLDSEIIHDLKVVTFQCFSLYYFLK